MLTIAGGILIAWLTIGILGSMANAAANRPPGPSKAILADREAMAKEHAEREAKRIAEQPPLAERFCHGLVVWILFAFACFALFAMTRG